MLYIATSLELSVAQEWAKYQAHDHCTSHGRKSILQASLRGPGKNINYGGGQVPHQPHIGIQQDAPQEDYRQGGGTQPQSLP